MKTSGWKKEVSAGRSSETHVEFPTDISQWIKRWRFCVGPHGLTKLNLNKNLKISKEHNIKNDESTKLEGKTSENILVKSDKTNDLQTIYLGKEN